MGEFRATVSADLFRRAMIGCGTEETRYFLMGVHVSACPTGGAVLAATDGHMLIACHDPDGLVEGEGIVSLSAGMKIALEARQKLPGSIMVCDGKRPAAYLIHTADADDQLFNVPDCRVIAAQFASVIIDGKFPDWRRVVPTTIVADGPVGQLNPVFLQRAALALGATGKDQTMLRLVASGDLNAPVAVFASRRLDHGEAFAIIMPGKHDVRVEVPSWASLPLPAPAQ